MPQQGFCNEHDGIPGQADAEEVRRDPAAGPWAARIGVILGAIAVVLLHLPFTVCPLARDQAIWLTAAMGMARGDVFFKDFLHFNLPGTAVVYCAAWNLAGDPRLAITVAAATTAVTVLVLSYFLVAETVDRISGAWAALVFGIVWPTTLDWWNIAQKDFLAMPWVLAATWFGARASSCRQQSGALLLAGGVCVGLASHFKPVFALTGFFIIGMIVVEGMAARFGRDVTPHGPALVRSTVTAVFWLTAGGVLASLPLIVYLDAGKALHDAYVSLSAASPTYLLSHRQPLTVTLALLVSSSHGHFGLLLIPAGFGAVLAIQHPQASSRLWLLVPALTALGSYLVQGRGWDYHAQPWYIMLCLFTGLAMSWLWCRGWQAPIGRQATHWAMLAAFAFLGFGYQSIHLLRDSHYGRAELPCWRGRLAREEYLRRYFPYNGPYAHPSASEKLCAWIRERTSPQDRILVWGNQCQIYVMSARMYATQAPFQFMLTAPVSTGSTSWQEGQRSRFLKMLDRDKPRLFIVTTCDASSVEPFPSDQTLAKWPAVVQYLEEHYREVGSLGQFILYERITS